MADNQRPRYHFIGYGSVRESADLHTMDDAQIAVDDFAARMGDHHGFYPPTCSVWDRLDNMTVLNWRPERRKLRIANPAEIFAKLARRAREGKGAPVTVISDAGAVTVGVSSKKVAA